MPDSWHPRKASQSQQQRLLGVQAGRQVDSRTYRQRAGQRRRAGAQAAEQQRTEGVSPTSADGEHDICDPYSQKGEEPVAPKFNPWSSCPITFDRRDHPTSIRHGGFAALVLDPIVDGFHLTRVLMDGGSSLNLLYQDTVRKMGIDPSRIKPTRTTFKGVIPGVEA